MKTLISPSVLASDYLHLADELARLDSSGADMAHIDIMDGHFVPNISFGPSVTKAMRTCTSLPFDVHLMISEPQKYIDEFIKAGADYITFHVECGCPIEETIKRIKSAGIGAGLSVKPATPAEAVLPYIEMLDLVLVMTVEPGFGGQKFMGDMMPKVSVLRKAIDEINPDIILSVDGGINSQTAEIARESGANMLVAGTAVFAADDMAEAVKKLRK